jgi:hypothetical protein
MTAPARQGRLGRRAFLGTAGGLGAAAGVASLARPGGNLTGISPPSGIYSKSAEMLAEIVPASRRLAYMGNVSGSASPHGEVAEVAAQRGLGPGTSRAFWTVSRPASCPSSASPT